MPNFTLTKDNGHLLSLPAEGVTAIASLEMETIEGHPDAKSLIFSSFQGFSVHHLAHTADEAAAVIAEAKRKKGITIRTRPDWLVIKHETDSSYIKPDALIGFEGVTRGDGDEEEVVLRVHFQRHDGNDSYLDGKMSDPAVTALTDEINRRK